MSQPRCTMRDRAGLGRRSSPNSSMSAPAMKPFALPERMIEPLRRIAVELVERLVRARPAPSADSVFVRRAGLVERERGEAVGVARDRPVSHRRSLMIACVVSRRARPASRRPGRRRCRSPPCRACRRCARSTFSTCSTMRAPDAPTGWPSAIAPPSTLSFASSSVPIAPRQAELVAADSRRLAHARRQREHLRRERLVDLPGVEVVEAEAVALRGSASPRARGRGPSAPDRGPPIASRRCGRCGVELVLRRRRAPRRAPATRRRR